jgi:hypothetical protein
MLQKELELIRYVRLSILKLTANLSEAQMNQVPDKMKNNLIWNLGHLVFTQQMLCYRLGGLTPDIDTDYFGEFAPDTIPARHIGQAEIIQIREAFVNTFEKLTSDIKAGIMQDYTTWTLPTGIAIDNIADALATNAIHEGRHFGVVISLAKLVSE